MKLIKVFDVSDMPENVFHQFKDVLVEDGYAEWNVGYFAGDGIKESVVVDEWLVKNGANFGELVLVKH